MGGGWLWTMEMVNGCCIRSNEERERERVRESDKKGGREINKKN